MNESPALCIAVDASRTTVARSTGTEYYALALLRAVIAANEARQQPHTLHLFFRDAPSPDLFPHSAHVRSHVIPFARLWTHLRFAAALWRLHPDLTFVPAHTLPFFFPGRAAVTVHDLGYCVFPQAHPAMQRRYLHLTTRYSAARAARILADSAATAEDLTRWYGTPSAKIRVVYPGVDAPPLNAVDVRAKYGLPARYFLFLGTLQPRKNIARIVQAYARWRAAHSQQEIGLVLAGGRGWLFDSAWVEGVPGVLLPGYVDEPDKGALIGGAEMLVFPSLYEGFGFPALEAMHCGTPVLTSRSSSLPELVGAAGLLVDPEDVEAIAAGMAQLTEDEALRARLVAQGRVQAARFTWEAAGQQALRALEEAAR